MPVTRTYCPPPPQNPADVIRADTCDPRRLMNPLAGITALHRNTIGYRHSSPDGDSPPFRITATHPVVPQPIMNYESCIMHCYTFSAKEKDSETGLSYFGSRYYSSDLSIWLSVDPMSDKYPSLSPYSYCANNPVKLVDPYGEEVVILLGEFMKESDRQNALNDLRNAAPNLKLELKGNNLIVGDGGAAKTKYEKQLANAISSTEVKSVITLELTEATGSYYGTDLIDGQYVSNNSVNPYKTNELEKNTGSVRGCGLMHEITEGYEMGKIAKRENLTHIEKAWRIQGQETIGNGMTIPKDETGSQRHLYEEGHQLATPQPGDWRAKPKRFFNEH